jgi:hypothetical protein
MLLDSLGTRRPIRSSTAGKADEEVKSLAFGHVPIIDPHPRNTGYAERGGGHRCDSL